jgi:hypothetical protein
MAKDKNNKNQENKIREGTDDYAINNDPRGTDRESYPKLKKQDQRYKDQPEFIDNEPNRKDDNSE